MRTTFSSRGEDADEIVVACRRGHLAVVKQHLDAGIYHIDATNAFDWTFLHIAAYRGRLEVVKELVQRGAKIDQANLNGKTALMLACTSLVQGAWDQVVEFLVESGASLEPRSRPMARPLAPPLAWACVYKKFDLAKLMLERGADVNQICDNSKRNLLHHTLETYRNDSRPPQATMIRVVKLLLERGADPTTIPKPWWPYGSLAEILDAPPALTRLREHWLRRIHLHVVGLREHPGSARHGLVNERGLMRLVVRFLAPGPG